MEKAKLSKGLKRLLIGSAIVFVVWLLLFFIFSALIGTVGDPVFANFGEVFGYYGKGLGNLFIFNYADRRNFLYLCLSIGLYVFIVGWIGLLVVGMIINNKKDVNLMWWGIGLTFANLLVYICFAIASEKHWAILNAVDVYADKPELLFLSLLVMGLGFLYILMAIAIYFWSVFHIFVTMNKPVVEELDDKSRVRKVVREEVIAAQPFKIEIVNPAAPVVIEKEVEPEPIVEPEPEPVVEEEEEDENNPNRKRIPFMTRILQADADTKANYNELKNEILSYGVKSRVSNSGDTFRYKRKAYVKIGIGGKSLKLYFALNPEDYQDSPMPIKDVGHKAVYGETPLLLKVRSPLSVRRAKQLIADAMEKDALLQGDIGEENFVSEFRSINADKSKKK